MDTKEFSSIHDLRRSLEYWRDNVLLDYTTKKSKSLKTTMSINYLKDHKRDRLKGFIDIQDYDAYIQFLGDAKI